MACNCAALLGLVNELMGGSLIAPAGQELRPSAAVTQWADTGGDQEISPQAWASLGVALTHQVPPSHFCTQKSLLCTYGISTLLWQLHPQLYSGTLCSPQYLPFTGSILCFALATSPTAILTLHSLCANNELFYTEDI